MAWYNQLVAKNILAWIAIGVIVGSLFFVSKITPRENFNFRPQQVMKMAPLPPRVASKPAPSREITVSDSEVLSDDSVINAEVSEVHEICIPAPAGMSASLLRTANAQASVCLRGVAPPLSRPYVQGTFGKVKENIHYPDPNLSLEDKVVAVCMRTPPNCNAGTGCSHFRLEAERNIQGVVDRVPGGLVFTGSVIVDNSKRPPLVTTIPAAYPVAPSNNKVIVRGSTDTWWLTKKDFEAIEAVNPIAAAIVKRSLQDTQSHEQAGHYEVARGFSKDLVDLLNKPNAPAGTYPDIAAAEAALILRLARDIDNINLKLKQAQLDYDKRDKKDYKYLELPGFDAVICVVRGEVPNEWRDFLRVPR